MLFDKIKKEPKPTQKKILIIGKYPPPIGGVTIHVSRLIEHLKKNNIVFDYIETSIGSIFFVVKKILFRKYCLIHLHTSSPYIRFFFTLICRLFLCNIALTYHGNIGRYKRLKNFVDYISIYLANHPIVINKQSLLVAKRINKKTIIAPAFIPPIRVQKLDNIVTKKLENLKNGNHILFCTNAYDVTFDKNGNEIYGLSNLIKLFMNRKTIILVISDPSGNYFKYLQKQGHNFSQNIIFITNQHPFVEVIKLCDCFIRATTTDGDSLSVKEAIYFSTYVIASDCVDRPSGTILYQSNNWKDLSDKIENFIQNFGNVSYFEKTDKPSNGYETLIREIYSYYLTE